MKLCVDCKWYAVAKHPGHNHEVKNICMVPTGVDDPDNLVTGKRVWRPTCETMREKQCGIYATYHTPR